MTKINKNKDLIISETLNEAIKNHQENNFVTAAELYKKILNINPNHLITLNNLGLIFDNLGEYQKALDCYEKIINIDPKNASAFNNLGSTLKKQGELQKATDCYEKAVELKPFYANAHYNCGIVFNETGDYFKAINSFEKALELDPNNKNTHNNLGAVFYSLGEYQKAKDCYERAIAIDPDFVGALGNLAGVYISLLDNFEKAISSSNKTLEIGQKNSKFSNQSIPLFRLKHDIQQALYLNSKNYKINGIDEFIKVGSEVLKRKENKVDENNSNQKILLDPNEIDLLLPYFRENHIYQTKSISESCINPNKDWLEVEEEYLNSPKQIMYIDDFLSDEALQELNEFCLVSKVWNREYQNKYLGAFSEVGFISPVHLKIARDLKKNLPKLFGQHKLGKFWGFKYDTNLGKGINIHADFAIHNLNFWITPDEFNNNKISGGLKVYDTPAPDHWNFKDYNMGADKIYEFLKENNANCTNIHYKFNRAVLFNSAYFHETDEIDFKDEYVGRRINNTYLFGDRLVKKW